MIIHSGADLADAVGANASRKRSTDGSLCKELSLQLQI